MILVTGATGHIGRQVVRRLSQAQVPVRALTRNQRTTEFADAIPVVHGDLNEPSSLRSALDGVGALYLFSALHLTPTLLRVMDAAGVRRLVFVSGLGTDPSTVEQMLDKAGMSWTHLRPSAFATNTLLWWAPSIRATDLVRAPYGNTTGAPIHEADVAEVAVVALRCEGHAGRRYELTGPESLTYREQVAIIGATIGRHITFVEESPAQARERMIHAMPEPIVDRLLAQWADAVGKPALVLPTVPVITGHPARSFAQWTAEYSTDFG